MGDIKDFYFQKYLNDPKFRQTYLSPKRIRLYHKITLMIEALNITSVIDIGCSYGLLVEFLNSKGIDAWGIDLPISVLKEFHSNLTLSKGKFIYGSIEDEEVIDRISEMKFQGIILLDTLRYIKKVEAILRLNAEFIIIKELSNNFHIRSKRKGQYDIHIFTPLDLLYVFNKYYILRIYSTKFVFHIKNPSLFMLKLMNLLPSYTVILKRKDSMSDDNSYSST